MAFVFIAALGWPLWHLTEPQEVAPAPHATVPVEAAKAIRLQLTFTAPPRSFAIRHLDKEIWVEAAPTAEMEKEIPMTFPKAGVDLVFHIEWPESAPLAAARIRLTDPDGDIHEQSLWGTGHVEEVLTFP